MKKDEIEQILDMAYPYLKKKNNDLSLFDMFDIAQKVWIDLEKDKKEIKNYQTKYFMLDRSDVGRLQFIGNLKLTIDENLEIDLIYAPNVLKLESGDFLDSDEELVEINNVELVESDFEWDLNKNEFEQGFEENTAEFFLSHLSTIKEVLGFDFKIINKRKKDIFNSSWIGQDKSGNDLSIFVENESTSDITFRELLLDALENKFEKIIWIAPKVEHHFKSIINWLNHNYGYQKIYLLQAERIRKPKTKGYVILFDLLCSPNSSRGDCGV